MKNSKYFKKYRTFSGKWNLTKGSAFLLKITRVCFYSKTNGIWGSETNIFVIFADIVHSMTNTPKRELHPSQKWVCIVLMSKAWKMQNVRQFCTFPPFWLPGDGKNDNVYHYFNRPPFGFPDFLVLFTRFALFHPNGPPGPPRPTRPAGRPICFIWRMAHMPYASYGIRLIWHMSHMA